MLLQCRNNKNSCSEREKASEDAIEAAAAEDREKREEKRVHQRGDGGVLSI